MAAIDDGDARAVRGKEVGGPGAGGAAANHRDIERGTWSGEVTYRQWQIPRPRVVRKPRRPRRRPHARCTSTAFRATDISVLSRSHDEEGALAEQMDASPGVDIEDSRAAARLGELSGQVLAAIAVVLPGIGSIAAAGPLSAGLGEAAGHVAGGLGSALKNAGVPAERVDHIVRDIEQGGVLLAVHAAAIDL